MAFGKGGELATESVPGSLLQVFKYTTSAKKSKFHLVSILISTATTGFSSAMISFDMDVSVHNRKEVSERSERARLHPLLN